MGKTKKNKNNKRKRTYVKYVFEGEKKSIYFYSKSKKRAWIKEHLKPNDFVYNRHLRVWEKSEKVIKETETETETEGTYYDVYINLDKVFLVDNKDSSRYIDSKENYFVMDKEPDIEKMKKLIKDKYKILTKTKNDMHKNDFSDIEINAYENDGIKGETVYSSEEEVIDALFSGVKVHTYKGRKKGQPANLKKLDIDIGPFGEKL